MDWLFRIVRIAGASSSFTAWLVQVQAEIDRARAKALAERLGRLEDPIGSLHPHIPEVAKAMYQGLKNEDESQIWFEQALYEKFSKPLAVLEARGFIKGEHAGAQRYFDGIRIIDPSFVMYMCALCESDDKMNAMVDRIESCERGETLDAKVLNTELDLPLPVIRACFEMYEDYGYGFCSQAVPRTEYTAKA